MMSKEFWLIVNPFAYIIFTALAVNLGICLYHLTNSFNELMDFFISRIKIRIKKRKS